MTKLSISQTGYPKKVIIGKDTVCAVTIAQLDTINSTYVDLDECRELTDSLKSEIKNQDTRSKKQTEALDNAEHQVDNLTYINEELTSTVKNNEEIIKLKDKKITWLKVQRVVLVTVTVVVTAYAAIKSIIP